MMYNCNSAVLYNHPLQHDSLSSQDNVFLSQISKLSSLIASPADDSESLHNNAHPPHTSEVTLTLLLKLLCLI